MRRLFSFLVFLVVVLVIIGFWRGWFGLLINQRQIQHDERKVERAIDRGTQQLKNDVHQDAQKVEQKTGN